MTEALPPLASQNPVARFLSPGSVGRGPVRCGDGSSSLPEGYSLGPSRRVPLA